MLARGLNFSVPPKKLVEWDYLLPFEPLYRSVSYLGVCETDQTFVRTRLKDIALSSYHVFNASPSPTVLTKAENTALKELTNVSDLVIQKSDKGNSVVLLDKEDYVAKMVQILADPSKFREAPIEPGNGINKMFSLERKLRSLLNSLMKTGAITKSEYDDLAPTGSQPGKMYGLAKVHKAGYILRHIMSAIGTTTCAIAKFLVTLIGPITTNEFTVKNSFTFAKELCGM